LSTPNDLSVVIEPIEDHDRLADAFDEACCKFPELLPPILPPLVLIKPNLCDIAAWHTGVTTDPRWLTVLSRTLRAIRSDVEIWCVESDAVSAYKSHRSCDETFERLGYVQTAKEANVELVNLSNSPSIEISLNDIPLPVRIPEVFLKDLFFISVTNLKVHPYERMTGILKNSLGLLPRSDISALHPYLPILIPHLHKLFPPDLCIIDGRVGLEGKGPIIGDPVRMDSLVVGNDAIAVDETACRLMNISPKQVPHLRQAASMNSRTFGNVRTIGSLQPKTFAFDPENAHATIIAKFKSRRFHKSLEECSNRWIDRLFRFRKNPLGFTKNVFFKLIAGQRAR